MCSGKRVESCRRHSVGVGTVFVATTKAWSCFWAKSTAPRCTSGWGRPIGAIKSGGIERTAAALDLIRWLPTRAYARLAPFQAG